MEFLFSHHSIFCLSILSTVRIPEWVVKCDVRSWLMKTRGKGNRGIKRSSQPTKTSPLQPSLSTSLSLSLPLPPSSLAPDEPENASGNLSLLLCLIERRGQTKRKRYGVRVSGRDPNVLSHHAVTQNPLQTHGGYEAEGKHLLRVSSGSAWSLSQRDYKTTGWASGPGEHEPEYIENVADNMMWHSLYWLPWQTLTMRRRLEEAFGLPWIESHLKLARGQIIGIGCVSSSWTLLWVCEECDDVWSDFVSQSTVIETQQKTVMFLSWCICWGSGGLSASLSISFHLCQWFSVAGNF